MDVTKLNDEVTHISKFLAIGARHEFIWARRSGFIWTVDYTGRLHGATASLVFPYDPALLPAGADPLTLGIWHYNHTIDQWQFGGVVDPVANTITFETSSFHRSSWDFPSCPSRRRSRAKSSCCADQLR
ncbi:MAG: hypothetical protein HY288_15095 [Planctomycetia bacterium]|nr:hypothetical protein [Planctomycetia bacterium]